MAKPTPRRGQITIPAVDTDEALDLCGVGPHNAIQAAAWRRWRLGGKSYRQIFLEGLREHHDLGHDDAGGVPALAYDDDPAVARMATEHLLARARSGFAYKRSSYNRSKVDRWERRMAELNDAADPTPSEAI